MILIIVIASLCGIGWINGICGSDGIFKKLPAACSFLPDLIFIPLFQCSKCNAFWWAIPITVTHLILPPVYLYTFTPIAVVGLTTILSNVTKIN